MSCESLWGLDMKTETHIKVSVAGVGRSQEIDSSFFSTASKGRYEYQINTDLLPFFPVAPRYVQHLHRGVAGVKGRSEHHY